MKYYYIIILTFLFSNCSKNRISSEVNISEESKEFYTFFYDQSKKDSVNIYSQCSKGIILFYFKIDSNGKIYDLKYSNKSSINLTRRFLNVLNSFNGRWKGINSNKIYLLPYIYNLQTGCASTIEVDSVTIGSEIRTITLDNLNDIFNDSISEVTLLRPIKESTLQ